MAVKVVDASVLAAIAFAEPEAPAAQALIKDSKLFAPDLLPYELANTALKKARKHPALEKQIAQALASVLTLDVAYVAVDSADIFSVAKETGVTAYDAAYVVLTRELSATLATLDRMLSAKAESRQ